MQTFLPPVEGSRPTVAVADGSCFAVPLSNFESYMWLDDGPKYPMVFFIELHLTGHLQRLPFEEALAETLRFHPLLTSCVRRNRWGRSSWVPAGHSPRVEWLSVDERPFFEPVPGIDLTQEPGLRMWVRHQPAESRVVFQFHHAATDGVGAIQFLGDLLARYGVRTTRPGEEPPEPGVVTPQRLHQREMLWPGPEFRRGLWRRTCQRWWDLARKRVRPLAPGRGAMDADAGRRHPPFPPFYTRVLDRGIVRGLQQSSAALCVTINDLCALAMFRTLAWWNDSHGSESPNQWLRLGVPLSLRTPLHDDLPAANSVSFMMLSQRQGDLADGPRVLAYVHRAAEVCAGGVEGRLFTFWLGGAAAQWPWLFLRGAGRGCFCTAVLANVGNVRRHLRGRFPLREGKCVAGSVVLESLTGAAPIRPGTPVAASIGLYAGRLYLNMNCDPAWCSPGEAENLIDRFTETIVSLAGPCPEAAGPHGTGGGPLS